MLHEPGERVPLFCIHPAGGQVTAYLRLRPLLGDEQPLFAIQSRASETLEREQPTVEAMAIDYATVIQGVHPTGPYRLLGWSMGGFIGHAIARELELRGERVEQIAMIDSRPVAEFDTNDTALAVMGVMHDLQLAPEHGGVLPELRKLDAESLEGPDLLTWCQLHGLIPEAAISESAFSSTVRRYLRHFQLLREHRLGTVHAPIAAWWSRRLVSWELLVEVHQRRSQGEGSRRHAFHVIRPPHIEVIAAELQSMPRCNKMKGEQYD